MVLQPSFFFLRNAHMSTPAPPLFVPTILSHSTPPPSFYPTVHLPLFFLLFFFLSPLPFYPSFVTACTPSWSLSFFVSILHSHSPHINTKLNATWDILTVIHILPPCFILLLYKYTHRYRHRTIPKWRIRGIYSTFIYLYTHTSVTKFTSACAL